MYPPVCGRRGHRGHARGRPHWRPFNGQRLVFGGKAGSSAAAACTAIEEPPKTCLFKAVAAADCRKVFADLQDTMFHHAMVERDEAGLSAALERVKGLSSALILTPTDNVDEIARTRRRAGQLCTAQCILKAALMRGRAGAPLSGGPSVREAGDGKTPSV